MSTPTDAAGVADVIDAAARRAPGMPRFAARRLRATANEGNVAGGDSGGAWMVQEAGQWRLAGVTVVAIAVDEVPPGATETQSSKFFAYGMSGSGAVDLWNPVNRDWVFSTVPEPGTLAAVGLGVAALLRRRRR